MFDAYTVKKVLPRLVIAAILIQLSYEMFTLLIEIVNQIAFGIEGFMYAPFGGKEQLGFAALLDNAGQGTTAFFSTIAIGSGGAVALGTLGILSLAGTALLALFVGYIVLVLRQAIIVALVVVSPLALVAWILPNTEKVWKLWWDSFFKLLLMYPLIILMIAGGRIFAAIYLQAPVGAPIGTAVGSLTEGFTTIIIIVGAYFGPFFLIPATFKVAGSAFANIAGIANDRSRGVFDRLKKGRQARVAENVRKMGTGSRFSERNPFSRAFNRTTAGAAVGAKGRFGFGEQGREALARQAEANVEDVVKNNQRLTQTGLNSDEGIAILALSGGSAGGGRQAADELRESWYQQRLARNQGLVAAGRMTAAEAVDEANGHADERRRRGLAAAGAVGYSREVAQASMTLMAQNKSRAIAAGDLDMVQRGAGRLAGGNANLQRDLMDGFEFHSRGAGRFDLGGDTATEGAGRGSLYQLSNAHPSTIDGWGEEALLNFQGAQAAGDQGGLLESAVVLNELKQMAPNATGDARNAIDRQIQTMENEMVASGIDDAWLDGASGVVDPNTGGQRVVQETLTLAQATPPGAAPGGAPPGWTPADVARGFVTNQRAETRRDIVARQSRTYRRPEEENR